MSIQNESDHAQLDELRQTVADLSTKIEVLNETIRKGKPALIPNWCTTILLLFCCRGRDGMFNFDLHLPVQSLPINTSSLYAIFVDGVIYSI